MNSKTFKLITSLIILLGTKAQGQDLKLAGVEYLHYPSVQFKDGANDTEISFNEYTAFIKYPVQLKNKSTFLVNGLQYAKVEATLHNGGSLGTETHSYSMLQYSFTYIHKFNSKLTFVGRLAPRLASDFEDPLASEDFNIVGTAILRKRIKGDKSVGFGLIYTTRFGKSLLIPTLQFQNNNDRHFLNLMLPVLATYHLQIGEKRKLEVGLKAGINGANFNNSASFIANSPSLDRFNYSRANVGPTVCYRISKMVVLESFAGISTMRKYNYQDSYGDTHSYDSETGLFVNIGIVIKPLRKNSSQNQAKDDID